MEKCITQNIEVTVKTSFHTQASNPELDHYVHIYEISIYNHGDYKVQLISREWFIKDLFGITKEVRGFGVIGEQPIIEPNTFYAYASGSNFSTTFSIMRGRYLFKRVNDGLEFFVKIPQFSLVFPPKLN